MPFTDAYRRQVSLLLRILPRVAEERCFALKGGTAINLFVRAMPRLSVDIDLTYLPLASRQESLAAIHAAMRRIANDIRQALPGVRIHATGVLPEKATTRLLVRNGDAQIKIEVSPVLRGCVFEPELRAVSPAVEAAFGFAEIQVVSFADLYAGKIVAALDRQHPRDLFDVRDLLANEGIDNSIRQAFLVYLISHNRPMAELLTPKEKPIAQDFLQAFQGMTAEPVSVEDLLAARASLIASIVGEMPTEHRRFLLTFKRGQADWDLLAVPHAGDLPAVRWKSEISTGFPEKNASASSLNSKGSCLSPPEARSHPGNLEPVAGTL